MRSASPGSRASAGVVLISDLGRHQVAHVEVVPGDGAAVEAVGAGHREGAGGPGDVAHHQRHRLAADLVDAGERGARRGPAAQDDHVRDPRGDAREVPDLRRAQGAGDAVDVRAVRDPAAVAGHERVGRPDPPGPGGHARRQLEGRALAGHRHRQARPRRVAGRDPGRAAPRRCTRRSRRSSRRGPARRRRRGAGPGSGSAPPAIPGVRRARSVDPAVLGETAVGVVLLGGDREAGDAVGLALHEVHPRPRRRLERRGERLRAHGADGGRGQPEVEVRVVRTGPRAVERAGQERLTVERDSSPSSRTGGASGPPAGCR